MMSPFKANCVTKQQTNGYPTVDDFYRVFDEGVNELYQLSFLRFS